MISQDCSKSPYKFYNRIAIMSKPVASCVDVKNVSLTQHESCDTFYVTDLHACGGWDTEPDYDLVNISSHSLLGESGQTGGDK